VLGHQGLARLGCLYQVVHALRARHELDQYPQAQWVGERLEHLDRTFKFVIEVFRHMQTLAYDYVLGNDAGPSTNR